VFQVHGVDAAGQVMIRRQLKRRYVVAFPEAANLSGRHRSSRLITLLVARAPGTRSQRALDARKPM
jgi:hypothetical protein